MILKILIGLLILVIIVMIYLAVQNINIPSHLGHTQGQLAPLSKSPNAVSLNV